MPKGGRRVRIFSALEVANICGVVNQTTINWIRNGHLKAFTTPGGQYRIYAKDLAAFLDKRGMDDSGEVLQVMLENANWDTVLIAACQSVNNTIKDKIEGGLSEYTIIQAFDWFEIGRKAIEEKPGFILLEAELPGVDLSRFMQAVKEDPAFGKPYVFLLTGNQKSEAKLSIPADMIFTMPLDTGKLINIIRDREKLQNVASIA